MQALIIGRCKIPWTKEPRGFVGRVGKPHNATRKGVGRLSRFVLCLFIALPAFAQHTVDLAWTASTTPGTTVNVYRAPGTASTAGWVQIATGVAAGGPYTDTSPMPGAQSYYVAANLAGAESAPSNEVSVSVPPAAATWFVRAGGGNRNSTNVPFGMCTGTADVDYPGTTTNLWSFSQVVALNYTIVDSNGDYEKITTAGTTGVQASVPTWPAHGSSGVTTGDGTAVWTSQGAAPVNQACAVNDFRYMWSDNSGSGGAGTWIIAGGDTVVVRGCRAQAWQINPSGANCRVGYDGNVNGNFPYSWCPGSGFPDCIMPPIPPGTAGAHTRILGGCAFGTYNCTPINDHYPFGTTNETQLFGGFTLNGVLNLKSTQYVDVEGFEITGHTANCTVHGSPSASHFCSTSPPVDDYANIGILTNNTTANVTLQDVYLHGIASDGMFGPIGGPFTMTRIFVGFNGFVGWSLDDGSNTPDAAGSQILASYVTMMGNGCYEEYPIVHTGFPARACYDTNSSGFGDGWSGQDGVLDTFNCDHCLLILNTKDGYIGPHTQILHSRITNSFAYGNMGAAWKWGEAINGDILFQNNLTVTNPFRMSEAVPGAAQNFNQSTGLPGSYLTGFNRGNAGMATITRIGSVNHYYGNTFIAAGVILFQYGCGFATNAGFTQETNCGSVPNVFMGNNVLGYNDPATGSGSPSAFYFVTDSPGTYTFITASFNNEFGLKSGTTDTCGANNITCVDPLVKSEPAQAWPGTEAALDVFNPFAGSGNSFYPTASSPLLGAGTTIAGLTTDFFGTARTSPPALGGAQLSGSAPTLVSIAVTPNPGSVVVASTLSMVCTSTFSDSSTSACSSPVWTDTNAHSSINSSTGVVTGASAGADTVTATIGSISGNATVNVSAPAVPVVQVTNVKISGAVTIP